MNATYASFGARLLAIIIDIIIIGVVQSFVIIPILAAVGIGFASGMDTADLSDPEAAAGMMAGIFAMIGTSWLIGMAIQVFYFTLMESSKAQGTVGKMALGIKVTDINGAKLDFGKGFVRSLSRIVSGMILLIGYIMAAFTEKKQALHDIIAGTVVVKK